MDANQELQLTNRAIRGRWNIPLKTKQDTVRLISEVINNTEESADTRLKAAKIAGELDKIDLRDEEIHTPRQLNVSLTKLPTSELLEKLQHLTKDDPSLFQKLQQRLLPKPVESHIVDS